MSSPREVAVPVLLALTLIGCSEKPSPSPQPRAREEKQPACTAPKSARALKEQAREAIGTDMLGAWLAPPLPTQWPPAGGGVEYIVYRMQPLPTGVVRFRIQGPSERIVFASLSAEPVVEALRPGAVLGEEADRLDGALTGDAEARLERAEQALVEVVAGCRSADEARAELAGYLEWLQLHPSMGRDLEQRGERLLSWLRKR